MGKLVWVAAFLLISPMVVADDDLDSAINMEDSSYGDNSSSDDSEDMSDVVRNPAQLYTPDHPVETPAPDVENTNQADFSAPPPTIMADKPMTPEKRNGSAFDRHSKPVEIMKPGNHNYKAKKVQKDSGVTIHFADEQAEEMKRQKKEQDLLKKFYQMEAQKKSKKAYYKKPVAKKRVAKKASRYKRISRR